MKILKAKIRGFKMKENVSEKLGSAQKSEVVRTLLKINLLLGVGELHKWQEN